MFCVAGKDPYQQLCYLGTGGDRASLADDLAGQDGVDDAVARVEVPRFR